MDDIYPYPAIKNVRLVDFDVTEMMGERNLLQYCQQQVEDPSHAEAEDLAYDQGVFSLYFENDPENVNVGAKPGQWGGGIAGHLDERHDMEKGPIGPFSMSSGLAGDQVPLISPSLGLAVSVAAWFCSASVAAARPRLVDCFRR